MTRPTIADLRDVLRAEANDAPAADSVLARLAAPGREPRHRTLAIAAGVVGALLAGLLVAVLRGSSATHRDTATPVTWRTYSSPDFGISLRYAASWNVRTYAEVSTFTAAIVFLSDQPMHSPCTTSANGSRVSCQGGAVRHIAPGGVSIAWSNVAYLSSDPFATAPGTRTRIGGVPAKVAIGTDPDCTRLGGRTSVTATIERPDASHNYFVMGACVAADRTSTQVQQVLISLHSFRQH